MRGAACAFDAATRCASTLSRVACTGSAGVDKRTETLNHNASHPKPKQSMKTKTLDEDVVAQLERQLRSTKYQLSTTQDKLGHSYEEVAQLTETKAQHEEMNAQLEGQLDATKEQLSTIQTDLFWLLTDLSQTQDELEHTTRHLQEEIAAKVENIGGLKSSLP